MTNKDKKDLAKMIAEEMKDHQPKFQCPNGMTAEDTLAIKNFVETMTTGKAVAFKAGIAFLVVSFLGALGWGIGVWVTKVAEK